MNNNKTNQLNPRKTFRKCGACSHAMFHILNHEYGNIQPKEEKASDMLAGGIAQKGHQCGMLWGGALAAGTESYRRYKEKNKAIGFAINASKQLVDSFERRTGTVNCRDITKVNFEKKFELFLYTLKVLATGFVYSKCFNLIVKWAPEAIQATNAGLSEKRNPCQSCNSCATEVTRKMGATDEESIMVAGFAGGIGLSGNACGALAAAIWYKLLAWEKKNPDKPQSMFKNEDANKILNAFYLHTGSEVLCKSICGKKFNTIDEHTKYIQNGGCHELMDTLAKA